MDQPAWTQGEKDKAWAISRLRTINTTELVAEQALNYFFADAGHKRVTQVLMIFEMAKVVLKFKAMFSGSETLIMEESLFAYFMADKHRRELLKKKTENILGLFKFHIAKVGKDKVVEVIHEVLGMKIKKETVQAKEATPEQANVESPAAGGQTETQVAIAEKTLENPEVKKPEGHQFYIDRDSLVNTW